MRNVTIIQDSTHHDTRRDRWIADHTIGATTERDAGYTLLELILVVLVIGLMVSIVIFAVSGMRAEAAESACAADRRSLSTAAEAYFAEHGTDPIPATGTDHDRFERTLVAAGFLRAASTTHDLDAAGVTDPEGNQSC